MSEFTDLIDETMNLLDEAYREFLDAAEVQDSLQARIAFYEAAQVMMEEDPITTGLAQSMIKLRLAMKIMMIKNELMTRHSIADQ